MQGLCDRNIVMTLLVVPKLRKLTMKLQKSILKNKFWVFFMGIFVFSTMNIYQVQAAQAKPPTSTTWYVNLTSGSEKGATLNNWMWYKGNDQGKKDLNISGVSISTVILDFGAPVLQSGLQGASTWGVFLNTSEIQTAVWYFISGYYYGAGGVNDTKIFRVAVGTSNSGGNVTFAHGQAWAQMVNTLNAWVRGNTSTNGKFFIYGASDIEPSFSTPTVAYNWVNGYTNAWVSPSFLLNYGSADGCPQTNTTTTPGACDNSWTQENIQYVSWGATPSYPFPEIYSTAGGNAKQWQQLSLYSYLAHGSRMNIIGPLSQSQACIQRGGCSGTNNTPDQAWIQLWTYLNGDARTVQNLSFSTDIAWRK